MHLTTKQIELLTTIGRRNPDGAAVDLDQLIERLSYQPSKQSIQFSIRALIAHGLMQKASFVETIPDELLDELSEVFED